MINLLFIPFLAFAYRSKGMEHPWGTTVNRIVSWAVPITIVTFIIYNNYQLALLSGMLAFAVGCIGHGSFSTGKPWDCVRMAVHVWLMMVFQGASIQHYIFRASDWQINLNFPVVLTSILGGLAYYIGYRWQFNLRLFGVQWCEKGNNTTCSEFLCGAAFGIGYAILGGL
jgi:hypothetical protein